MKFELSRTVELLSQTPYTLARMLEGLSPEWTQGTGDIEDWAPYEVIGHLIQGEETDWMPRAEIILAQGADRSFEPYDRTAQFKKSRDASLNDLLTEFAHIRTANLERLMSWELRAEHFELTGTHPALGEVTLAQLLATWAVHDLTHIHQVVRYMASKYTDAVGPWKEYLSILKK